MSSNLLVGARVVVYVNGTPFARVSSFDHGEPSPSRIVYTVDSLEPADIVPGPLSVAGSMVIYRSPHDGGIEGGGMIPTWNAMTRAKYFSILVIDRISGSVLFESRKNSITSQSWRITARGHIVGNISFTGLSYNNDSLSPT